MTMSTPELPKRVRVEIANDALPHAGHDASTMLTPPGATRMW